VDVHSSQPRGGLLILLVLLAVGASARPVWATAKKDGPKEADRGQLCEAPFRPSWQEVPAPLAENRGRSWGAMADSAAASQPPPLILEDPPQPLIPQRPRTEADQDRLEALSLFATARTHERRQQYAQALRLYQRALRCDPGALTVVRAIIPLALRLKRDAEAVRYVLKAAELEEPDPERLQRLGAYLFQTGNLKGAVRLYERALAAQEGAQQTADDVRLRMVAGRLYLAVGEHGKAADCFARVIHALDHPQQYNLDGQIKKQLLDEPGLTYNLFGECFLLADRLDEAQAAFEKAQQLAPNEGLWQFNQARILARRHQPQQALAALETCYQQHLASEGTAPFELLAEVLADLGKKGELIERLEKLRAEDPKNLPLGYFLAEQYHKAERFGDAEALYRGLIEKAPTPTGYRRLAEIYRKTGRVDALLATLGEVMEKTGLLETFGSEVEAISGDADLMRCLVETARKRYRDKPEQLNFHTRFALALLALEAKQFDTAAEFFNLALEAKPDHLPGGASEAPDRWEADVFLTWGLGLLLGERPAEAVQVFQRGIDRQALPEDDPRFYYLLAGALAMDNQTEKALAAARKAIEKKKDVPRSESRVAWILYRAHRYDQALEAYRQLLEKFDADYSSSETRDVLREARLVLSNLCVLKENLAEAEEWLQQVLDEFPDDVGASNDLGYLWADQGKHLTRALEMIQHAVDAEPDNAAYRDSLGWVYYRLGRDSEAVAELQEAAAAEDEPDPVILDHLGDAHLKANQHEEAKQAWRRAVAAFTKHGEPEKAKLVELKIQAHQ
jgi:tetratricopeptide (TPR) repeat protein